MMKDNIGQQFIEQTKYPFLSVSDQNKGIHPPPLQMTNIDESQYIELPKVNTQSFKSLDLKEAITHRHSIREYSSKKITIKELSFLLWAIQGIHKIEGNYATFRTVPSAGARHAFETFFLVNKCESIENGLYHYNALQHGISLNNSESNIDSQIVKGCLNQTTVKKSAITLIWVAEPYRMTWRYAERGYRYLYMDIGHVCQNLYLAAEVIDCGVCAIAAFDDDKMNQTLKLDGKDQFVIYCATLGKTL